VAGDPERQGGASLSCNDIPGLHSCMPGMTHLLAADVLSSREPVSTSSENAIGSRKTNQREISMRKFLSVLAALATLSLTNCGYNAIQSGDEQVKSAWSEVINQYQRRADLVPNLVNSVKGFAQQEKDVLLGVTNARAKVGSIQATPELINDPGAFAKFQQAQGELTSALSKLLVVTENYPQLKSDALFRDLMAQLEGTENRITVARNRYIKAVQDYNVTIRSFPSNLTAMAFGYREKVNFTVDNEKEISSAPKVDFNPAPAPAK
jgi:LemA protein